MSNDKIQVLSLQPYYGGSHRQFMEEWISYSRFNWRVLSLPDRHWKWRMRHAAVHFAEQINLLANETAYQALFCTDMLNVAEFKGLLKTTMSSLPMILYFHENQFAYPTTKAIERDMHFAFTNLTSALAADEVWFNSEFNLQSMLEQIEKWCKIWPDYQPKASVKLIEKKSKVMSPGVQLPDSEIPCRAQNFEPMHIVWAARWEHDKNPGELLQILELIDGKFEFGISVIGKSYTEQPREFDEIKSRFSNRILHWGYQSKQNYIRILQSADVVLSTAVHEFFGISVVEAMAAGCIPILPDRLSYPELLGVEQYPDRRNLLYGTPDDAAAKLVLISNPAKFQEFKNIHKTNEIRKRFSWQSCATRLDNGIESLVNDHDTLESSFSR